MGAIYITLTERSHPQGRHALSAPRADRHPRSCALYVVGVFNDNDEGTRSAQSDFVRSTRREEIDDRLSRHVKSTQRGGL